MEWLLSQWPRGEIQANGVIVLHLLGASLIGLVLGYERSFQGRAAGMRTYAMVCVGAALLTVLCGFPESWFGGRLSPPISTDPTRVIQGIVTGIGFLGAGVIMREGFTVHGLTTAASIWVTAAIGVLIGAGFPLAAMAGTLVCIGIMEGVRRLERILPHRTLLHLTLVFPSRDAPTSQDVEALTRAHGYLVIDWAWSLKSEGRYLAYQLVLLASSGDRAKQLADDLSRTEKVIEFQLSTARN